MQKRKNPKSFCVFLSGVCCIIVTCVLHRKNKVTTTLGYFGFIWFFGSVLVAWVLCAVLCCVRMLKVVLVCVIVFTCFMLL